MTVDKRILRFIDRTKQKKQDRSLLLGQALEETLDQLKISSRLKHPSFGSGVVVAISDDIIEVEFGFSRRKFPYPQAFSQGYLELVD